MTECTRTTTTGHGSARHHRRWSKRLGRFDGWRAHCEQCGHRFPVRANQWEAALDARAHRNGWTPTP